MAGRRRRLRKCSSDYQAGPSCYLRSVNTTDLSRFRLCFQGLARRFAQRLLQRIAGGIHGLHAALELRIDRRHESAQFRRRGTELVVLAQMEGA